MGRPWELEKSVVSGDGWHYLNYRRVNASLESLMHPGENLLGVDGVEWVEILYPAATIELWGVTCIGLSGSSSFRW